MTAIGLTRRAFGAGCDGSVVRGERPWLEGDASAINVVAKRHAPATLRNRDAIAKVLAVELPKDGIVLEVASGSGEHAIHFAALFPQLIWQPSDPDAVSRASIGAWAAEAGLPNLLPPVAVDASAAAWPVSRVDAILCINMIHISPWEATLGLLDGAARMLAKDAPLILYGPFFKADIDTAPSNLAFDANLKSMDARYGIRAVEDVDREAGARGLERAALYPMPANNLMLVYRVNR